MHPDDDSQTTLSKWPFILGDVLLVGTALAIAILGDWQLTDWQVGACVAAVALGAALFALPYVVEFQVRVREEREDRAADLRILEKHILNAEQDLTAIDARIRALESVASDADKPNAALIEIMDQKFAQLETARSSQEERLQTLQEKLEELSKERPERPPAFDPEILKPIEKRLKDLESRPKPSPAEPAGASGEKVVETPVPSTEKEVPAEMPVKTVAQIEYPKRATRERHGPEEARLLQRAITEKGDNSSTAVSRIIGSKTKEQITPAAPVSDVPETEVKESESADKPSKKALNKPGEAGNPEPNFTESVEQSEPEKKSGPSAERAASESSEAEKTRPQKSVSTEPKDHDAAPDPARADPPVEKVTEQEAKATPTKPPQKKATKAQNSGDPEIGAPKAESSGMLFDEEKITSPVIRTKAKKNDAVVTASVFIGIGNKPYLRGDGGGLSWERGQVMEFQEIGKWRWVAPSDLDTTLEVQIYCNDEEPDQSGRYRLEPGQKLEVSPVF